MTTNTITGITNLPTLTTRQATPDTEFDDPSPTDPWPDGSHRRCQWNEDLCTETPTHFLTRASTADEPATQVEFYCVRHWVLTIARIHEVELRHCSCPLPRHITQTGALTGPTWTAPA